MEPTVTALTLSQILGEMTSIIADFGLVPFLTFGAVIGAAAIGFKRLKSAAR